MSTEDITAPPDCAGDACEALTLAVMPDQIIGWHFANNTLRDGSPLPQRGEAITWYGHPSPCVHGLHASERAIDALMYAPGSFVSRVCLSSQLSHDGYPYDKWVGRTRVSLSGYFDATDILRAFARACALDVAHLRDAASAAASAASAACAAVYAAHAAAKDAAYAASAAASAACAAGYAAYAAAKDAAKDAAYAAAYAAARDAQNRRLEGVLRHALGDE